MRSKEVRVERTKGERVEIDYRDAPYSKNSTVDSEVFFRENAFGYRVFQHFFLTLLSSFLSIYLFLPPS